MHPSQRRWRAGVAVVTSCALLVACEPAGDPGSDGAAPEATPTDDADAALGAPAGGMPASLDGLRDQAYASATQWQDEPVLASLTVDLAPDGWTRASATYLAPDADRMFEHVVSPDGTRSDRPTLATLGLEPVTGDALGEVPGIPPEVATPETLAELAVPALEACEAQGTPESVLYTTGAPVAWDGAQWTQQLRWTATVRTDAGALLVVDPVTGEQLPGQSCFPGPPPDAGSEAPR